MAWVLMHKWKQGQLDGSSQPSAPIDFNGDTIKLLLIKSGNEPTVATDQDVADLVAGSAEVTGTNYARKSIASVTITLSSGTVTVDASDPSAYSQSSSGFADARYAALFKSGAADGSSPVIAYADLGGNKGNVSGNLTLQFSGSGIFTAA